MNISKAIKEARKAYRWPVTNHEPTSVNIVFASDRGMKSETQLDLYGDTPEKREKELEELWDSMYKEFESAPDKVLYIEALGYVV